MTSWPEGAPRPGDRAELSRRVEAADIELCTRTSGDRNPLHYDLDGTGVCYTTPLTSGG